MLRSLSEFPRATLCHRPTPLEPMENLTRILGGPNLYIKRDDCTGLATGGNKARKLKFLMGDAIARSATTVITVGAVQSNHARQTAAAAAKLNMKCELILEERVPNVCNEYETGGNLFLDRLLNAKISFHPQGCDTVKVAQERAEELLRRGERPYIIPGGGSNGIGALGYVECLREMLEQAKAQDFDINYIVVASGSAGTHAGLIAGTLESRAGVKVLGISVQNNKNVQEQKVYKVTSETIGQLGLQCQIPKKHVVVKSDYVGPGYGQPTKQLLEAIELAARQEGIILDPVYSGKAMAGLIDMIGKGVFTPEDNVVFLHTGGSPAVFVYRDIFRYPEISDAAAVA